SPVSSLQLHRLEVGRQDDLQHFAIVGVAGHGMLYARWLDPAASLLHDDRALSLEIGLYPALQHVDHLEVDLVIVTLRNLLAAKRRQEPYHMSLHQAVRRRVQPEIAVLRVGAQPIALEILFPLMTDREPLRRPALVRRSSRRGPSHFAPQLCLRLPHDPLL